MIFEKTSEDPTPAEDPPSYEDISGSNVASMSSTVFQDTKTGFDSYSSPSPPPSATFSTQSPHSAGSYSCKGKGKAPVSGSSWWGFGVSSTTREVRSTVLGIIRDLVSSQNSSDARAAQSILESCAEACAGYSLSLSSLLQEKSIEEHTPLYWAIVNRPPENRENDPESSDLLMSLLSFSAPLIPSTVSEVRNACLITSDQAFFQRLRLSSEFAPLSGTDQMLLGITAVPDDVTVENLQGDEGSFAVHLKIPQFQKRMRVSKEVAVEFIARGRMWRLAFTTPDRLHRHIRPRSCSWCIVLSLLETSPPTWIDSRIIIADATSTDAEETSGSALPSPPPSSPSTFASLIGSRSGPKPDIIIRLQSADQLVSAAVFRHGHYCREIVTSLDDSAQGSSLQHTGSSYIGANETLKAKLEARLTKPEAECIIC